VSSRTAQNGTIIDVYVINVAIIDMCYQYNTVLQQKMLRVCVFFDVTTFENCDDKYFTETRTSLQEKYLSRFIKTDQSKKLKF